MVGVRKITTLTLPQVIAHRGANTVAPENTLSAMKEAHALGATWVEFDVVLTADDVPIVFHDEEVSRATNGRGFIHTLTLAEVKALDAGSWFHPTFAGETIPTLRELLAVLAELKMNFNLELKPAMNCITETVRRVVDLVHQVWPTTLPQPLYSSFAYPALTELRRYDPQATIGYLMHEWQADWQSKADAIQCVTIHLHHPLITPARVQAIKSTQRGLLCYTVNSLAQAQSLFEQGVDAVFTDAHACYNL